MDLYLYFVGTSPLEALAGAPFPFAGHAREAAAREDAKVYRIVVPINPNKLECIWEK